MPSTTWLRGKLRERTRNVFLSPGMAVRVIDHIEPADYLDLWSSQPFNGQVRRLTFILSLAQALRPTLSIETGTYVGSSTPYLSALAEQGAVTIEINDFHAERARKRFVSNHASMQITQLQGDSASRIREVLARLDTKGDRVLAYLDAHWHDSVPTAAEITALAEWGGSWVAVVDDFKVPDDSGYGFDAYGETVIGVDLVPPLDDLSVLVVAAPSTSETGARRGTGVVMPKKVLQSLPAIVTDQLRQVRL